MSITKNPRTHLKEFWQDLKTVLHYPLLLGLFMLDITVVLPATIFYGGLYFHNIFLGLALLPITQLPITIMVAREIVRQSRLKPLSEAWETSPEKWRKTLDEYVASFKKGKGDENN